MYWQFELDVLGTTTCSINVYAARLLPLERGGSVLVVFAHCRLKAQTEYKCNTSSYVIMAIYSFYWKLMLLAVAC